jgi:hypothetical protein
LRVRFGVAQFDKYDPLLNIEQLARWGFDYCEPQVIKVMTLSDAEFQTRVHLARAAPIHVEAMNSLMPAALKVVGPEVDITHVRDYVEKALARRKHWVREWLYLAAATYRKPEWQKTRERNEALDTRIYARAAASQFGIDRFQEQHWAAL